MRNFYAALETASEGTTASLTEALDALKFNEAGLIPAVAQDASSGQVLMLAWMNRQALETTLQSGRVTYYSRSRQELWRKGDTSGHIQRLRSMQIDCDGDTLLLSVDQTGAACHTHREHCFYLEVNTRQQQIAVNSSARPAAPPTSSAED